MFNKTAGGPSNQRGPPNTHVGIKSHIANKKGGAQSVNHSAQMTSHSARKHAYVSTSGVNPTNTGGGLIGNQQETYYNSGVTL